MIFYLSFHLGINPDNVSLVDHCLSNFDKQNKSPSPPENEVIFYRQAGLLARAFIYRLPSISQWHNDK